MTIPRGTILITLLVLPGVAPTVGAQDKAKPAPEFSNVRYGDHSRNVFDLWRPPGEGPFPLVLYIHGGGFKAGDKKTLGAEPLRAYLQAGWAVAAINYRFTDAAPAPAQYLDCARALQTLRHRAKEWKLDPRLVASTGGSAGAGTSMWMAFHDDLADPNDTDPVARESTRLTCIAVSDGQCSYDPRFAEKIGLPRPNFERHAFFLPFYGISKEEIDTPDACERYEKAAPITYLSKDDPPALLAYSSADVKVDAHSDIEVVVHHPKFGIALKERMEELGLECVVRYKGQQDAPRITPLEFIQKHFALARTRPPDELADLIRRLDHEDPVVREAATAAILKRGMEAAPALERAMLHASQEVRSRAAEILGRLPGYPLHFLLNHPELPVLRRLWNAIIETLMTKRPIPEAIWKEFGSEKPAQEDLPDAVRGRSHGGPWMLSGFREQGKWALHVLASSYGISGKLSGLKMLQCEGAGNPKPLPGTLALRLLKLGVDETAFEEVFATILVMNAEILAEWFNAFSDEDWDPVLQLLVHFRRRKEAKPMAVAPVGEEAWNLVSRGPWIRGLASALGRAFSADPEPSWPTTAKMDGGRRPPVAADSSNTKDLTAIYVKLLRLDQVIGLHFHSFNEPEFFAVRPPRLPAPRYLSTIDRDILARVPAQDGLDREARCVVEALVTIVNLVGGRIDKKFLDEEFDATMLRLIPAVAKHLVEDVRRTK